MGERGKGANLGTYPSGAERLVVDAASVRRKHVSGLSRSPVFRRWLISGHYRGGTT